MTQMSDTTTTRIDHTAKAFDTDLQEITRKVAEMGGLVERQIADSVQALVDRDIELDLACSTAVGTQRDAAKAPCESKA